MLPHISPTRLNRVEDSYIDFFIITPGVVRTEHGLLATKYFESDHKAVEIIIIINNIQAKEIKTYYDYYKINIERYKGRLEAKLLEHELPIYRNATISEIDISIERLNIVFKETIEECVPKKVCKNYTLGKLPYNIINLMKKRKF